MSAGRESPSRTRPALLALVVLGACFTDRERPGPVAPGQDPLLAADLQAPPTGSTAVTGVDIGVEVRARDLLTDQLEGVGFVARRLGAGGPPVDSAAVRFAARSDTTHVFAFQVPDSFPTNTQVDVYGIAYGPGGAARLSAPVHLVVVNCGAGTC